MVNCTAATIHQYLRDYGWSFQPVSDTCVITGWQGKSGRFPLEINLSETWIQFKVTPLISLEFKSKPYAGLARFLLQLNLSTRLVKISMERNGTIELSLEAFQHNFDYEQFCRALGILAYYADTVLEEVVNEHARLSRPRTQTRLC